MEKLTENEVEYLERYEEINGLFLRLEAIENNVENVEDKNELENLREETDEVVTELKFQLENWQKRCDLAYKEVKNKIITEDENVDMNNFYASLNPSLIGKSM